MEFKKIVVLAVFLAAFSFSVMRPPLSAFDDPLISEEVSAAELIAAERQIKTKLGLDPGNAALYFELSNIYAALFDRSRKKNSKAMTWLLKSGEALEKTVMIDPGHKIARYNLGVVYKRQGKMELAREELRKALRISNPREDAPFITACWMQIGMVYAEQGFLQEAEDAFEKAREFDYGNEEVLAALSDVKQAKKSDDNGEAFSPGMFHQPLSAAAMSQRHVGAGYDPAVSPNEQVSGLAQALPYLGQMIAQKFGGGGGQDDAL